MGLLRPRIYLPSGLSESNRAYVLAHEETHLRCKDHWWKPFAFCLLALYWFDPLAWAAYFLACWDIEFAYDDEGTRARKNYLIKDGILAGRLHSAQTAAALGEEVSGNARAIDCTFEPIVHMTATYIEPGKETFEQLLASIQKGYYIKTISHGSGMSTFTIAPMLAYKIENGRLGKPTQISVITGSVFETLGLIDGLSDKLTLLSFVTGGCGKMEQMGLPVGFGGPCVRVSEMNVQ